MGTKILNHLGAGPPVIQNCGAQGQISTGTKSFFQFFGVPRRPRSDFGDPRAGAGAHPKIGARPGAQLLKLATRFARVDARPGTKLLKLAAG